MNDMSGYEIALRRSTADKVSRQKGVDEGYQEGLNDGHRQGYQQGIAEGNVETDKAMGYIRQHVADKENLQAALRKQQEMIHLLEHKTAILEREVLALRATDQKLRANDTTLRQLVDGLKGANTRFQDQIWALDTKLVETQQQHNDQLAQYNRSMVFSSAVRSVLEELTSSTSTQSEKVKRDVRELFAKKYAEEVRLTIQEGVIKGAPETNPDFIKGLPRTQKFIVDMLNAVGKAT